MRSNCMEIGNQLRQPTAGPKPPATPLLWGYLCHRGDQDSITTLVPTGNHFENLPGLNPKPRLMASGPYGLRGLDRRWGVG